jgi:hypothetical protein
VTEAQLRSARRGLGCKRIASFRPTSCAKPSSFARGLNHCAIPLRYWLLVYLVFQLVAEPSSWEDATQSVKQRLCVMAQ